MKELKRENGLVILRFDKGEDLMGSLTGWLEEQCIQSAAILGGIGMLSNMEIGRYDGREYSKITEEESCEILSLQGSVSMKEGKPFVHLHVSFANHDFHAIGGHLFSGTVSMTIELVLAPMSPGLVRKPMGGVFWQMDS
ncbi:MAG TPA: DNA-binding protein [Candidatus Sabulitectum sp.]|nr:DNA-binding protein [Candidatus Sabulitectum sp.]HPJ29739.1 DNA-binding protein [Candidatus Sabulitectum sp.]HPR23545.1 DNA-binding protein [Candidatus Sabulitectum sp.]